MPEAARTTDPVSHGGAIATGSQDVLTEGLPPARLNDLVKCELHVEAIVGETSQTVLVNGRGFARKGDGCICNGSGSAGPGQQETLRYVLSTYGDGKTIDEIVKESNGHGPHFEFVMTDLDGDGQADTMAMRASAMAIDLRGEHGHFKMEAFSGSIEATNRRGEHAVDFPIPLNQTRNFKARASTFDTEGRLQVDGAAVEAKGSVLSAEASMESTFGDDGNIVGARLAGGAKASAVSGSLKGEVSGSAEQMLDRVAARNPLFAPAALGVDALSELSPTLAGIFDTPLKIEIGGGGSLGSVGADGSVEAYYNRETEEAVFGLGGSLALLAGLGLDVKLTVGGKGKTGASGPNLIVSGAAMVIVGD